MKEFNLSWEQAVEAMKHGHIVECDNEKDRGVLIKEYGVCNSGLLFSDSRHDYHPAHFLIAKLTDETNFRQVTCCIDNCKKYNWRIVDMSISEPVKTYAFKEAFGNCKNENINFKVITENHIFKDYIFFFDAGKIFQDIYIHSPLYLGPLLELIDATFIKLEPEVKENGLGLTKGHAYNAEKDYWIEGSGNDDVLKALSIYKQLLSHTEVSKIVDDKYQYYLSIDDDSCLEINRHQYYENKLFHLSPFFNYKERAEKAINDIGKENLIFMFKALKGV